MIQIRSFMRGAAFVQLINTEKQTCRDPSEALLLYDRSFTLTNIIFRRNPYGHCVHLCDLRSQPKVSTTNHLASRLRLSTQGFLYLYTITAEASHTLPPRVSEHQRSSECWRSSEQLNPSMDSLFDSPSISKPLPES